MFNHLVCPLAATAPDVSMPSVCSSPPTSLTVELPGMVNQSPTVSTFSPDEIVVCSALYVVVTGLFLIGVRALVE